MTPGEEGRAVSLVATVCEDRDCKLCGGDDVKLKLDSEIGFVRVIEHPQGGKIAMILRDAGSEEDDGPTMEILFRPEGLGVCALTTNYRNCDGSFEAAHEVFTNATDANIVAEVEGFLERLAAMMIQDGDECA